MIFNLKQKIKKREMLTLIDVCHRAAEAFSLSWRLGTPNIRVEHSINLYIYAL